MSHRFASHRHQQARSSERLIQSVLRSATVFVLTLFEFMTVQPVLGQEKNPNSNLVAFNDHVKPILRQHCLKCHGEDEQEAGINLQQYTSLLQGGGSGRIVVSGQASQSVLLKAITNPDADARMPPGSPALSPEKVAVIRRWIDQGLRESISSKSLSKSRDFTFRPIAAAEVKPQKPAMPGRLPSLAAVSVRRPLPVLAIDASRWAPIVAAAGYEHVRLIHAETERELGRLPFPEGTPNVIRFSRNGAVLMVAGGRPVEIGRVVLYDVRTGRRLAEIGDETDSVLAADLNPDQTLVALGGSGRTVKVFSTTTSEQRFRMTKHTDWITSLAFSPDGTMLASGDRAGGIHIWDTESGGLLLNLEEHSAAIHSLDWRPDGKLLASAGEDGRLVWWDINEGFPAINKPNAHPPARNPGSYGRAANGVLSCRFGANGQLVSTGRDRTIRIWNTSGQETASRVLPPAESATLRSAIPICSSFTSDATRVACGDSEGRVLFWKTN